jgi:hypothetical protein
MVQLMLCTHTQQKNKRHQSLGVTREKVKEEKREEEAAASYRLFAAKSIASATPFPLAPTLYSFNSYIQYLSCLFWYTAMSCFDRIRSRGELNPQYNSQFI